MSNDVSPLNNEQPVPSRVQCVGEGLLLAVAGLFVHRHSLFVGGWSLPWGIALVVAAVALRCRVLRSRQGRGANAAALALTWLAVTSVAGMLRTGDTIIAGDVIGSGYVLGGAVVVGVSATWPSRRERQMWAQRRR